MEWDTSSCRPSTSIQFAVMYLIRCKVSNPLVRKSCLWHNLNNWECCPTHVVSDHLQICQLPDLKQSWDIVLWGHVCTLQRKSKKRYDSNRFCLQKRISGAKFDLNACHSLRNKSWWVLFVTSNTFNEILQTLLKDWVWHFRMLSAEAGPSLSSKITELGCNWRSLHVMLDYFTRK